MKEWLFWKGNTEQWFFLMGAVVFLVGSVYCAAIDIAFRRLLKQIEHPEKKKNKRLCVMMKKFETIYQLHGDIPNVELFVKCDLYKLRAAGLPIYQVHHFSVMLSMICVLCGAAGAGISLYRGLDKNIWLGCLLAGVIEGICIMILYYIPNFAEKRKIVYLGLREYLENTVVKRYQKEADRRGEKKKNRNNLFCISDFRKNGSGEKRKLRTFQTVAGQKVKEEKRGEKKQTLREGDDKILENFFEEFFE